MQVINYIQQLRLPVSFFKKYSIAPYETKGYVNDNDVFDGLLVNRIALLGFGAGHGLGATDLAGGY